MSEPIRALSVRQPWAELIISGRKTIELRTWTSDYRGQLWLHVGRREDFRLESEFGLKGLFRGGFIGAVELIAIVPMDAQRWESWRERHCETGAYRPGLFGLILKDPRRFNTPIQAPGALRLFIPSPEFQDQLRQAISIE
ncbi:ASCH domain-containing protein [Streptosporangium carneum]|nr:ASCH domain-containing protein [Streptosporangium carneum]